MSTPAGTILFAGLLYSIEVAVTGCLDFRVCPLKGLRMVSEDGEIRDPRTNAIIGAAMEVHRHLGPGFLEAVYQDAMSIELGERRVPFKREAELRVNYKGRLLDCSYRADFLCFDRIIVELKALDALTNPCQAQLLIT